jgi:hypothetical protein
MVDPIVDLKDAAEFVANHFAAMWAVISGAWDGLILVLALMAIVMWVAFRKYFAHQVSSKNSIIVSKDAVIETLDQRNKLKDDQLKELAQRVGTNPKESPEKIIAAAMAKIDSLDRRVAQIARYEAIFWLPLTGIQKAALTAQFGKMGKHSVQVTCTNDRDCVELAHDVKDCFTDAGWNVANYPMKGGWGSSVANGFQVFGKRGQKPFNAAISQAIADQVGAVFTSGSFADEDNNYPEIAILIGPRRSRND